MSFPNFFTQLPCRMWEITSSRQQINMQGCQGHTFVHSFAVLVKVLESPMKRNAVNLFSTVILNEDNRYCPKKLPPGQSLYLLSRKHFSVGTVHCFLQQNKSFGFDPQHNLEPINGVQNRFERYVQLNTLIILHMPLRLLKRNTKFQLNRSLVI